jgi:hypoxanthine phosphoribosyltransferase
MAREIEAELGRANPVILAVMHGGAFCAVELAAHWRFPYEFDYVHVTRYANSLTGGALEWRVRPSAALAGRAVLIVDDILDRGTTLRALQAELDNVGVARRYTAALVVKRIAEPLDRPRVDFGGLEIDDVYVFGCGMDCRGYWRGLRALWAAET